MTSYVGSWDDFDKNFEAINRSTIIVRGDHSLDESIDDYKIYINGFIHGRPPKYEDIAPPNSLYTKVAAGKYRVVVREFDQRKADRIESNVIEFDLREEETMVLRLVRLGNSLLLSRE